MSALPDGRGTDTPTGVFRFREYAIEPDREPDAETMTFTGQCAVCGRLGPTDEGGGHLTAWMLAHLRAHPDHLSYREIITRPYRAVPGRWL